MATSVSITAKLDAAERFLRDFASCSEARGGLLCGVKEDAIAYFASRGQMCDDWIKSIEQDWRAAADEAVEIYKRSPDGKVTYDNETVLLRQAPLDKNYVFFWDESSHAPMLRAARWCKIVGFELWFERLSEYLRHGALDEEQLFDTVRCDEAVARIGSLLRQVCYSTIRESCQISNDFGLASSAVFAASRLRLDEDVSSIIERLLNGQRSDGGWPWFTYDKSSHIIATTQAVHALALSKPSGWARAVERARDFLWQMQQPDGSWTSHLRAESPWLNVHETVLALDAIELSSGGTRVTFSLCANDDGTKATQLNDADSYCSKLVGNKIDDPTGPMSALQIAKTLWPDGYDWDKAGQSRAARKRAVAWMTKGKLPANLANGLNDHYVVSASQLRRLAETGLVTSSSVSTDT